MKNNFRLVLFISILLCIQCENFVSVDTDYSPLNQAFESIKKIQIKYDKYREIINKNISIEYPKCENIIKEMKCNNIDQWQSVIEELSQENENSQKSEIPFLIERKKMKVDRFASILNRSEFENERYQNFTGRLKENQQKIMDAFYFIEEMYKLPQEQIDFIQLKASQNETEPQETEQTQSAAQMLNADVPDLAKEQLNMAKKEYDIADESIQAQTTANLLRTFNKKMTETIGHVDEAYNSLSGSLQSKKEQYQGDILKVRVMVQNEVNKQEKNNEKITQLQGQIDQCTDMPTDILKDCNPIKVNASKLLTEIEIIQTRTALIHNHISEALEENVKKEQVEEHVQNLIDGKSKAEKQAIIDSYLKDPEVQSYEPKSQTELEPIHHLKDNLPEQQEETETTENETQTETETNETQEN